MIQLEFCCKQLWRLVENTLLLMGTGEGSLVKDDD